MRVRDKAPQEQASGLPGSYRGDKMSKHNRIYMTQPTYLDWYAHELMRDEVIVIPDAEASAERRHEMMTQSTKMIAIVPMRDISLQSKMAWDEIQYAIDHPNEIDLLAVWQDTPQGYRRLCREQVEHVLLMKQWQADKADVARLRKE
jgi:hypothetical protein